MTPAEALLFIEFMKAVKATVEAIAAGEDDAQIQALIGKMNDHVAKASALWETPKDG